MSWKALILVCTPKSNQTLEMKLKIINQEYLCGSNIVSLYFWKRLDHGDTPSPCQLFTHPCKAAGATKSTYFPRVCYSRWVNRLDLVQFFLRKPSYLSRLGDWQRKYTSFWHPLRLGLYLLLISNQRLFACKANVFNVDTTEALAASERRKKECIILQNAFNFSFKLLMAFCE